ncbi:transient receptor potential ion channel [Paraphaeosphaeria minitans]|uniref:Transient receptor potential ion channel n=1 Tax=Paraphaeosphaeria minitans TaxID=565426 RepID=A0A9P6KP83_9PLEO|nr:transient receptor potential ion channel [Paraphaeosphaeria minitans]
MRAHISYSTMLAPFIILATAPLGALASDVLKTTGYSSCQNDADIKVNRMDVEFVKSTRKVTFDVSGTSLKKQDVIATLVVNAYGIEVYKNEFDPCDGDTKVPQLCPVPAGTFGAQGTQTVPEAYMDKIPAIAFNVPDLDSQATLQLKAKDGTQLACITSTVSNGKTMDVPAAKYIAAGIAAGALAVSSLSALASAGHAGAATSSPNFGDVIGWFQSMALNGMMSVKYPSVYQSFSRNFAFSTGLVGWDSAQRSIDNFRNKTGGNLTADSVDYLEKISYTNSGQNLTKRAIEVASLWGRDDLSVNKDNSTDSGGSSQMEDLSQGIKKYAQELSIPNGNTFMTILLIFAIVVASITVAILLFKVILETWALCGNFPKRLTGFRKRYWWTLAKTITHLILLLYGIWTLYCVYQFKSGDSWAAKVLAGVTLAIFTAVLAFFIWKIWSLAQKFKRMEGNPGGLYENKELWRKYSFFYENYKQSYWWLFIPLIVYMFARGCVIAGADGHGMAQVAGQLIVESLLLILLLWSRPFSLKSGNWINIIIQVVRVLSVVCILIFVEELGVAQTTKTVTGLVMVVMQAVLTGLLAILIAVNAIVICCKENPHKKQRKEAGKSDQQSTINLLANNPTEKARDLDNLTPLDARNSLLMDPQEYKRGSVISVGGHRYDPIPLTEQNTQYHGARPFQDNDHDQLMDNAAGFGRTGTHSRGVSADARNPSPDARAPRLPSVDMGTQQTGYTSYGGQWAPQGGYQGHAY